MADVDPWKLQLEALGAFIRTQRKLANLSLRELADLTEISNPYLSQIERGMHEPSVRVLRAIAGALNLSAETMLAQAGLLESAAGDTGAGAGRTEAAIRSDPALSDAQKEALLAVYRSYRAQAAAGAPAAAGGAPAAAGGAPAAAGGAGGATPAAGAPPAPGPPARKPPVGKAPRRRATGPAKGPAGQA